MPSGEQQGELRAIPRLPAGLDADTLMDKVCWGLLRHEHGNSFAKPRLASNLSPSWDRRRIEILLIYDSVDNRQ